MRLLFAALSLLTVSASNSFAQQFGAAENLGPRIPTPQAIVERMLEAARVTPDDVVYDLGSGDGRIVVTAVQKYGAHAVGIEIMPDLCKQARDRIVQMGLGERARIIEGNALHIDLSPATVVTMFFMTNSNERLKPALAKLHPGARVVSNQFAVSGWKPTQIVRLKTGRMENAIFVYEIGRTN